MNKDRSTCIAVFFLALIPFLTIPVLFPSIRILFLAPLIVYSFYVFSPLHSLWITLLAGLSIDLLSSHFTFGIHTVSYSVVGWILYPRKKYFYLESLTTLPLLTTIFSVSATLLTVILISFFDIPLSMSFPWIITDCILFPLLDGLYALLWFVLPVYLWNAKRGKTPVSPLMKRPQ